MEDLDPNLTFGAFTWDDFGDPDPANPNPNREIDFEDSRWGAPGAVENSQFVVQPWHFSGNLHPYVMPDLSADPRLTRYMRWTPQAIEFMTATGVHLPDHVPPNEIIETWRFDADPAAGRLVPRPGQARWRFNLWINHGGQPDSGQPAEVIVSDFRHFGRG